jgi:hypothetical protein
MDEKGVRIYIPIGEEVIILIRIKEIYTGILENYMSLIIIKYISVNSKAIPPVIIIPKVIIMVSVTAGLMQWSKA